MNWYIFEIKLKFYVCGVRGRPRRGASALEWASVGGDFGNPYFGGTNICYKFASILSIWSIEINK